MSTEHFEDWLDKHSSSEWLWYVKRLAANDTHATGAHQAGPYFPKEVVFTLFPSIKDPAAHNPRANTTIVIDSHAAAEANVSVIWYNQKTRNECRVTGWGGGQSPLLDPESTGSVVVLAFQGRPGSDVEGARAWLCNLEEEEALADRIGTVEPGEPQFLAGGRPITPLALPSDKKPCWLTAETMPAAWQIAFPSGLDIVARTVTLRKLPGKSPDDRLLERRACEYELFRSIEQLLVLPRIKQGFATVDEFIEYSNGVNNRRKARSGRSLELQVAEIFREEGVSFSHGEVSEGNKKPDFLLPSAKAYRLNSPPLWMLAAKTTCKDRWRQILNEADQIPTKHLITLQEGVSGAQFAEMRAAGVCLVVPAPLQGSYPMAVRKELLALTDFIALVSSKP